MSWEVKRGDKLYYKSSRKAKKTTLAYIGFKKKKGIFRKLPVFEFDIDTYVFKKANPSSRRIAKAISAITLGGTPPFISKSGTSAFMDSPLSIKLASNTIHEVIFYLGVENWFFAPPAFEFKDPNANINKKSFYKGDQRFWGLKWFSHKTLFNDKQNGGIRVHYDCRGTASKPHKGEYPFNLLVNINQRMNGKQMNTPLTIDPIIRNDP